MRMRRLLRAGVVILSVLAISMGTTLTAVNNVPRTSAGFVTIPIVCQFPVMIDIKPETLNQQSGNVEPSVTVQMQFPNGTNGSGNVTAGTMKVAGEQQAISASLHPGNAHMLKFSRADVLSIVGSRTGEVTLVVDGWLSGCRFSAQDTIMVIVPASDQQGNGQQSIQQESANEPVQIQGEIENVKQDDSTNDSQQTDPSLDKPELSEQDDPASGSEQDDPPEDEPAIIDDDDAVTEPVRTDPPGNETGAIDEDGLVKQPVKTNPPGNESGLVVDEEPDAEPAKPDPKDEDQPVKQPVKVVPPLDETDTGQEDVPVKQPLEIDPPVDGGEGVEEEEPVKEPVDEPEIVEEVPTVIIPIPTRPQVEQPEEVERDVPVVTPVTPVNEPEDSEEDVPVVEPVTPVPPVDEPVVEPPVESTPPEAVKEEPEAVEHCPIDAELKISPETLDLNGEVDEALFTFRFPESVAGAHSVDDVTLVEVRVKLGEDLYGALMVEAKPDAENPRPGEFELTLEQMVYLLEGRLGEVTLEARGSVNDCAFAGTDTLEVIATVVEEPSEPVNEEPQEVVGEGDETSASELEQTQPVEEVQEQTGSTGDTEEVQTQTTEEESQPQAVKDTEEMGVVEEEEPEAGE